MSSDDLSIAPDMSADPGPAPAGPNQSPYARILKQTVTLEDKILRRKRDDVTIADLAAWAEDAHAGGAAYLAKLYGGDDRAVMYDHAAATWWQWQDADARWTPCDTRQELTWFGALRTAAKDAKRRVQALIDGDAFENDAKGKEAKGKAKFLAKKLALLATSCSTAPWMEHVLKLARSGDGSLGISGGEWDAGRKGQPMLLPCSNGVVDFRKPFENAFRKGCRGDLFKLRAETAYEADAPCPRFEKFLLEIMGGDQEKVDFLQRFFGYSFLRDPRQRKIAIFDGTGNNGKSLLFDTIEEVVGNSLITTIPSSVLLHAKASDAEKPSPFLASVAGKAIVYCSETPEGRALDVNLVKQLTGNDKIKARKLYSEPVEMLPTWQICIFTNNRPQIKGHDPAIWRRIIYIHMAESFVLNPQDEHEHKIDISLPEKLIREKEGILNWIIRGAFEYLRLANENNGDGLQIPESIIKDTLEYREEQNLYGQFMGEAIKVEAGMRIKVKRFTELFNEWLSANGYKSHYTTQSIKSTLLELKDKSGKKYIKTVTIKGVDHYAGIAENPDYKSNYSANFY